MERVYHLSESVLPGRSLSGAGPGRQVERYERSLSDARIETEGDKMKTHNFILIILLVLAWCHRADAYENFSVAVYCRAYETREMADPNWLDSRWQDITKQVHVDKVYLETHRDLLIVDDETLNKAKTYFHERGIRTAGGITLTVNERNRFETFCYSNPEHRQKVKEIVEHTARLFDEMILDDFFF